jgi:hypothetical protein
VSTQERYPVSLTQERYADRNQIIEILKIMRGEEKKYLQETATTKKITQQSKEMQDIHSETSSN